MWDFSDLESVPACLLVALSTCHFPHPFSIQGVGAQFFGAGFRGARRGLINNGYDIIILVVCPCPFITRVECKWMV